MRLDHLLSKEQQAPRGADVPAGASCFLVEHWLFAWSCPLVFWLVRSPFAGLRNGGAGAGTGRAHCWVLREQASLRAAGFFFTGRFPGGTVVLAGVWFLSVS